MSDPHINTPKILRDLIEIKKDLADPDDIREVEKMEKKAERALAQLSLKGNVGVALLVKDAKEQIEVCDAYLRDLRPTSLEQADCVRTVSKIIEVQHTKDLYLWFIGRFVESEEDLKDVEAFIERQTGEELDDEMD